VSSDRRAARERALELLYEAQAKSCPVADVLQALPVSPDPLAVRLACGVDDDADALDALIEPALKQGWTMARLAVVDHMVLRMGAWELRDAPDIPTAVVISEAVELAKQFSGDDAGRFVNGLLATLARQLR